MNYYAARQRESDQRWDFTCRNDNRIWPVGNCAERVACSCALDPRRAYTPDPDCERCGGRGRVDNPEHCGGHDTPGEAERCYAEYLLAEITEVSWAHWAGCVICDTPTKHGLQTRQPNGDQWALCDAHRTHDQVRELAPQRISEICSSY